jgi:uncharacterized RDD family membrane protein YckC
MEVIDQPFVQSSQTGVKYGGFWVRLGALIIDGLILAPVTFGITYFNITTWKSPLLLVVLTLISLAYKPFMESTYGATLGKMAFKLKVLNLNFEKASLQEILLRNIFNIVPALFTLAFTLGLYTDEDFQEIDGFSQYSALSAQVIGLQVMNFVSGIITIADAIVLLADKNSRSLHDKIGKTCVVEEQA